MTLAFVTRMNPFDGGSARAAAFAQSSSTLVAVSNSGTGGYPIVMSSGNNGVSWTVQDTPYTGVANRVLFDVCYAPSLGLFLAVSGGVSVLNRVQCVLTSPDAVTWTQQTTGPTVGADAVSLTGCVWSPQLGLFVVSGQIIEAGNFPSSFDALIMTSPDGITWTRRTVPSGTAKSCRNGSAWSADLGLFAVAVLDSTVSPTVASVVTSPTGVTWTARTLDTPTPKSVYAIVWSSFYNKFFLGADAKTSGDRALQESSNGTTWADVASPWDGGDLMGIDAHSDTIVATGFTTGDGEVASSDDGGASWTAAVVPWDLTNDAPRAVIYSDGWVLGGSSSPDSRPTVATEFTAAYQRIYGWRATIDDNALETIEMLVSPQTGATG
jgi:hypothetical protein